ncbi:MAG: DUF4262 domain-containing protein [Pseudonocardia sp.]|nr:DUF4262 domain-containing protein [Pseudonocardia sp.]
MCWRCDHPGSTAEDALNHMKELMLEHGWAIQGVEGDRLHPPWAYTLGLTDCGLPELVITGMALNRAGMFLNRMADHALRDGAAQPGERIHLCGGPLAEIVELPNPDAHLHTAYAFFGPRLRAIQMVWADDRGRWPWELGFRGCRGGQPVLGPRTKPWDRPPGTSILG